MCAVLPVPSGNLKHGFRPTRTVILPDYQGLGIGTKLSEVTNLLTSSKDFCIPSLRLFLYFSQSSSLILSNSSTESILKSEGASSPNAYLAPLTI